jgi:hypothetical protein
MHWVAQSLMPGPSGHASQQSTAALHLELWTWGLGHGQAQISMGWDGRDYWTHTEHSVGPKIGLQALTRPSMPWPAAGICRGCTP